MAACALGGAASVLIEEPFSISGAVWLREARDSTAAIVAEARRIDFDEDSEVDTAGFFFLREDDDEEEEDEEDEEEEEDEEDEEDDDAFFFFLDFDFDFFFFFFFFFPLSLLLVLEASIWNQQLNWIDTTTSKNLK